MASAKIYVNSGFGIDVFKVVADSNKELLDRLNERINRYNGLKIKVLGIEYTTSINKVEITYTSGKTFTKKYN